METTRSVVARNGAIDIVRGAAIVFMAIDHTRDFLTGYSWDPENLSYTWPALFFTRWITHFSAPIFFLLAGTGAFFLVQKSHSIKKTQSFLVSRGAFLIALELTMVGFAWTFVVPWGMGGVLWCLGWSMILLGLLVRLPRVWVLILSLLLIFGHDAFDTVRPDSSWTAIWHILHMRGDISIPITHADFFVLFPIVPWCAVMALGYCIGSVFTLEPKLRDRWLMVAGLACILAFLCLRGLNWYGNPTAGYGTVSPGPWMQLSSTSMTIVSFLDVEKYPPSLQYLLMTLGPSLLALSLLGGASPSLLRLFEALRIFGTVPLFFYVLHLYLIHFFAVMVALATSQPWAWLLRGGFFFQDPPPGYGHGLAFIYGIWFLVLALLYYPCSWYAKLKRHSSNPLLSFI